MVRSLEFSYKTENSMKIKLLSVFALLAASAGAYLAGAQAQDTTALTETEAKLKELSVATFAGGCFWCMEGPYDKLDGVISTTSGYIGGQTENPTYKEVSAGGTGHTEAVQIVYDPKQVSYEKLLDVFWVNHDPTEANGQFCDKGGQYRPGVFYHEEEQKNIAETSRANIEKTKSFDEPVVTEITMAGTFYPAEDYHQDYYRKNPYRYKFYRYGCGRDSRLQQLWGTPES
jgi:peptide-methionine (S)-S-oxide reductase